MMNDRNGQDVIITENENGRPLPSRLRSWLEHSYRTDLGHVRMHTGRHADATAGSIGAVAASRGSEVYLSRRVDLRTARGLHVLAHEVAHTMQPHSSVPSPRTLGEYEQHAKDLALIAMSGARVATETAPERHESGVTALQGFNAWEHRLLGDVSTSELVRLATRAQGWEQVVERQLAYMQLWRSGIAGVTRAQMQAALPDARVVTLPSGLLATLGELNAVGGDFAADPAAIATMSPDILGPILQQIRQESANRFLALLGRASQNFTGAITKYLGHGVVDLLRETMAIDAATASLGVNHYNGLLARNACHFAPFAWHRWRASHGEARRLAGRAFTTRPGPEKDRLVEQTWITQAYADHFIEDAFAAGHLINKTLIMQWFTEWAAGQPLLPVPDWDMVKNMTATQQPDLMGPDLYKIFEELVSNDPQTAEEQATFRDRVAATKVRATSLPREVSYRQYLAFLNASVVQLSSNFVHNHFNDDSLLVRSSNGAPSYRIFGDEKLLEFGKVIDHPSTAVKVSQEAVRNLLETGRTGIAEDTILSLLPASVEFKEKWLSLQEWHTRGLKEYCFNEIFGRALSFVKSVATIFSPRLGLISRDQTTSGLTTAWNTSLPGSGYEEVHTLFDGTHAYAASNGYVYRLDPTSGAVKATNGLPGRGKHDVRMASRGRDLFVGTNGYVLALDSNGLAKRWETSLPGSGYDVVNLLVTQDSRLYAASNGHVYRLDPATGRVLHHNSLTGYGNHEIRLAEFLDVVAAGTNGWVVGLRASNIDKTWERSLKGAGWDVVDLVAAGTDLVAGSNGHLYVINPSDGSIKAHNSLPGEGYTSVQVTSDGTSVYAGTHGDVLCFTIKNLSQQWKKNLSVAAGRVVDVYWQDGWLFAGVNGYLYQLDPTTGAVLYSNALAGRGYNDIHLASDGVTVYCGINGYVVGVRPDPR